jgi:tetratricopeptide (TPR) repeat protein/TolB-like protein
VFFNIARFYLFSAAALLAGLITAGCSRQPKPVVERLAVVPFENLTGDPALDWVGPVLAEAVVEQLTGSAAIQPSTFPRLSDAALARGTMALRGYYILASGRLRLVTARERLSDGKVVAADTLEGAVPEGVPAIADALAHRVDSGVRGPDTRSVEALRALTEAKAVADPAVALPALARAVSADPDFGPAYVTWARALLARGDTTGVRTVLDKARARGGRIAELARTELTAIGAAAGPDRAARTQALVALTRVMPADAELLARLAGEQTAAHRYAEAAELYRKATALDPLNGNFWNQLGYSEAHLKNLAAARAALLEYQRIAPQEANPLDSMGDVHFYLGAFAEAAGYYLQAYGKDPSFLRSATLYKAARARLMTGDVAAANELFRRYQEARRQAGDRLSDYAGAQWLYLAGRRPEAVARMRTLAGPPAAASAAGSLELVELAEAQLSAWAVAEGNLPEARRLAEGVLGRSQSPMAKATAVLALLLSDPSMPARLPEGSLKTLGVACRSLLSKQYPEAVTLLTPLAAETDPLAQEQVNVLLAWALVESGRAREAAPLLDVYGVPQPGLEPPFGFLTFPRVFLLKAEALAAQGRATEATQMRDLYRKLSGT